MVMALARASRLAPTALDPEALIDELFAYVTDPRPSRNARLATIVIPVQVALGEVNWPFRASHRVELGALLETMVLDGVDRREHVADLVYATSYQSRARIGPRSLTAPVDQRRIGPLTDRETEVLRLVAAGKTNREIGAELVLSVYTVKRHLWNILGKLGAPSRVVAAAYAVRAGIA